MLLMNAGALGGWARGASACPPLAQQVLQQGRRHRATPGCNVCCFSSRAAGHKSKNIALSLAHIKLKSLGRLLLDQNRASIEPHNSSDNREC